MRLFVGTSGFSYKEWCGAFYPDKMKPADMLGFYSQKLSAVEINATFYRMPSGDTLSSWASQVSGDFLFVLKASRRITHIARLKESSELCQYLWNESVKLGSHRGPFLVQLPPNLRADLARLESFVAELPDGMQCAFEFRHPSWSEPAVIDLLRARNHALCTADTDESPGDLQPTASFGYLRMRKDGYGDADLVSWAKRILAQNFRDVFVFFKHEDSPDAPNIALRFARVFKDCQEALAG
jgi:uncharacterized protein YecE (DUF72 family)